MKSLADIHEELEDAMLAAGALYLMQYEVGTLRSLREFDEYVRDEADYDGGADVIVGVAIINAVERKGDN